MLSQRSLPVSGSMNWVSSFLKDGAPCSELSRETIFFYYITSLKSFVALLFTMRRTNIGNEKNEMPQLWSSSL